MLGSSWPLINILTSPLPHKCAVSAQVRNFNEARRELRISAAREERERDRVLLEYAIEKDKAGEAQEKAKKEEEKRVGLSHLTFSLLFPRKIAILPGCGMTSRMPGFFRRIAYPMCEVLRHSEDIFGLN